MELNRKIDWGTEVNDHLKKKERKIKKTHQISFGSSVNDENENL